MIKIKAKINFDIVEQMEMGVGLDHLFDGFPPAEITCDHPDDMAKFIKYALSDEVMVKRTVDYFNSTLGKEETA